MIYLQRTLKLAFTATLTVILIACGGGGGGGGNDSIASTSVTNTPSGQAVVSPPTDTGSTPTNEPDQTEEPETPPPTQAKTSVTLSWVAPSSRQNGDPLLPSELAGYEIYYFEETAAEADGQILLINDASVTEATIEDLTPGTYYFAIATIDTNGLESDISDYVAAQIK